MSHPCLIISHPCLINVSVHFSSILCHSQAQNMLIYLLSFCLGLNLTLVFFYELLMYLCTYFYFSYCTTLIQDILSTEKRGLLVATATKLSSMRPVQESTEPKENVVSTLKNTLMSANCAARILDINPSLMSICYSNIQIVMTKLNW